MSVFGCLCCWKAIKELGTFSTSGYNKIAPFARKCSELEDQIQEWVAEGWSF